MNRARASQERNFHSLMGGLLVTSLLVDPAIISLLDSWDPPGVTFVTFAIAFVWVLRFSMYRADVVEKDTRKLRDRIERLEEQNEQSAAMIARLREQLRMTR